MPSGCCTPTATPWRRRSSCCGSQKSGYGRRATGRSRPCGAFRRSGRPREAASGGVDELQRGPDPRAAEDDGRLAVFLRPFEQAIAELLGERVRLVEIRGCDRAGDLVGAEVHERGKHADLDALVELLATARKPQSRPFAEMDLPHAGPHVVLGSS